MTDLTDPIRDLTIFDIELAMPTDDLEVLAARMRDATADALLIRRRDDQIAVLTEHDVVRGVAEGDTNVWATDVMSRNVIEADGGTTVRDAVRHMMEAEIRHLVVRDGERLGILCLRDCVAPLLAALGDSADASD